MQRHCALQDSGGLNLLAERDAAGNVTAEYVHGHSAVPGIGTCVASRLLTGGGTYYRYDAGDVRGSVVRRTDENGNVIGYYEYNAFGAPLRAEESGPAGRFRYQSNWLALADSGGELYLSERRIYHARSGHRSA